MNASSPAWVAVAGGAATHPDAGGRPCRAVLAAATAAAAATALVAVGVAALVVTSASPLRGAPGGGGEGGAQAAAAAAGFLFPAARAAADAAAPGKDPVTDAWLTDLRATATRGLPPLPAAIYFRRHDGLYPIHVGRGLASGQVLLEVPERLLDVPFVLAAEFFAFDAGVELPGRNLRLDEMWGTPDRVHAFRRVPNTDPPTLELYRPPLDQRSVRPDSVPGMEAISGISSATVQFFSARPIGDGRLLIDAGPWVAAGFRVGLLKGFSTRFVGGAAHPRSVTFKVKVVAPTGGGGSLNVMIVGLPRKRMTPLALDDRVGYFAEPLSWVDDYSRVKPAATEAHIMKWDLAKHPVITYYVDPSVPRAFWPAVVDGIRRWNPAFAAAGHARPVLRAVVPTDKDWPVDYAADDARFNTISFVPGDMVFAYGYTTTDPRTGEILNADITFRDDFVRVLPNDYRQWFANDEDGEASRETEFVYQHLADVTAHEVGHTVGLRHNFRGSSGIPWSQLTNASFVQNHGLTTSVMDYLPYEPLPRGKDGSPQRFFASPVVGAYDVAAIRYGYTAWRSQADATAFAESVAASGLALGVDSDVSEETDALAQQWDMSATPLEWHRHNVRTIQRRVRLLVRTAGSRKASSAADLSTDVMKLVSNGKRNLIAASKLVGGTSTDRSRFGGATAVTLVDAATEADAAKWVLSQLDPEDGLLSASTVAVMAPHLLEMLPPVVCLGDPVCLGRRPPPLATKFHTDHEEVLSTLLSPSRLLRLTSNAAAAAAAGDDPRRRLSVEDLLAALSDMYFGRRWAHLPPPAAVTGGSLFRAEAQARWVSTLKALVTAAANGQQAAAVGTAASGELFRVAAAVAAAVDMAPDSTHLRGLHVATSAFLVE